MSDTSELNDLLCNGGSVDLAAVKRDWFIDAPLNLRRIKRHLAVRGHDVTIYTKWHDTQLSGMPVIDMVGALPIRFDGLRIHSANASTVFPSVAVLHGRESGAGSAYHTFTDCVFSGRYTVAPLFNSGAECVMYRDCRLENYQKGGHGFIASSWIDPSKFTIKTPYGNVYGARAYGHEEFAQCGAINFVGGKIVIYGRSNVEVCVWLAPGAHQFRMFGTFIQGAIEPAKRRYRLNANRCGIRIGDHGYRGFYHDGIKLDVWAETHGCINGIEICDQCDLDIGCSRIEALENPIWFGPNNNIVESRVSSSCPRMLGNYAGYQRADV